MRSADRPLSSAPTTGRVLGGEAWVVPHEPGGAVWVTASAPAIRVMDLRGKAVSPREAVAAR